jgi:hypothetical protein
MSGGDVLHASPLLIARGARSGGGTGGRRIVAEAEGDGYVVRVEGTGAREDHAAGALQAVQAFNHALRDAARAGLTARPEPAELTVAALEAARRARTL